MSVTQKVSRFYRTEGAQKLIAALVLALAPLGAWPLIGVAALLFARTLRQTRSVYIAAALLAVVTSFDAIKNNFNHPTFSVALACLAVAAVWARRAPKHGRVLQVSALLAALGGALALSGLVAESTSSFEVSALAAAAGTLIGALSLVAVNLILLLDLPTENYRVRPTAILAALWLAVACLWQISMRQENEYHKRIVAQNAIDLRSELQESLRELSNSLDRYAKRIEYLGTRDAKYLEIDSATYLRHFQIISRIGITDPKFNVLRSYPLELSHQVVGFNEGTNAWRKLAFESAIRTGLPSLSHSVQLRSGRLGFVLPVPMFRHGQLTGVAYAALDAQTLFTKIAPREDFRITVTEDDKTIFAHEPGGRTWPQFGHSEIIDTGLSKWVLSLEPNNSYLLKNSSRMPVALILGALLISLVLCTSMQSSAYAQYQNTRNSEWRKALLNSADYAIISCGADGTVLTFNRAAERLLGYAASEVVGIATPQIFHVHDEVVARQRELEAELNRPITMGMDVLVAKAELGLADEHEWTFRRKDQSLVPVSLSISALRAPNGTTDGYLGIAIDLSERKAAQRKLEVTLARLERVIEASGEGFWERDYITREIHFIDQRAQDIFGLTQETAKSIDSILAKIPVEDRELLAVGVSEHVRTRSDGFYIEFRVYNDLLNQQRWVRVAGSVKEINGEFRQLVSTVKDVTEIVEARKSLQSALQKAEEATLAKSAFLASMSHEIRTPLNGVIGMTDILLTTPLSVDQRSYVEIVNQSGNALLRLINDILDFSKIEAGKMELDEAPFDLAVTVESQAQILAARAQAAGIALATFVSPDLTKKVYGDQIRLGQVLLNLMSNAIKFTNQGGVVVNALPKNNALRFEVIDTGIGIAPENRAKLFRPFVQESSATAAKFGGTGLGLSISKQFVELMGGTLGVESILGKGSMFWFEIPLRPVRGVEDMVTQNAGPLYAAATIEGTDPFTADVLSRYLEAWKIPVVVGSSRDPKDAESTIAFVGKPQRASAHRSIYLVPFSQSVNKSWLYEKDLDGVLKMPIKQADLRAGLYRDVSPVAEATVVSIADAKVDVRSGINILVADDNSVNRQVATTMLESLGHHVTTVTNGSEVLSILNHIKFDLILMDCQMPVLDGFGATKAIRADNNPITIIALTANTRPEHVEECYISGMNDFIEKPLKRDRLAQTLKPWLIKISRAA